MSDSSEIQPLVSIVTPSYNQGKFVERTIRSVLCQDYPHIQYIFVDALSNDETPKILQKYAGKIDVVIREKDKGQSDALNKGFKRAEGQILAYLNSDDCYSSSTVVAQAVEAIMADPDVDLVYGRRKYVDENGCYAFMYPFAEFDRRVLYQSCFIPQECCFWTRMIYDKAGSFVDADLQFAMDYDLWFRMLEKGACFKALDSFFGLFRWYPDQKSMAEWKSKGLPEIARLQKKYLGHAVSYNEMTNLYLKHHTGVDPGKQRTQENLRHLAWEPFISHCRDLFAPSQLDAWVYGREHRAALF